MNWSAILLHARLADTAYNSSAPDAELAFGALGFAVLGQYMDGSHQAYALQSESGYTLAISGTRFGHDIGDVIDDANFASVNIGPDARISAGSHEGVDAMWAWAKTLAPVGSSWTVTGHSLGGERALMTGLFLAAYQIKALYAYEAPKFGDAGLWKILGPSFANATCVINGNDLWAGWPLVSDWSHPPVPHIHLLPDGTFQMVGDGSWPVADDPADHSIDLVVSRIAAIAAKQSKPSPA